MTKPNWSRYWGLAFISILVEIPGRILGPVVAAASVIKDVRHFSGFFSNWNIYDEPEFGFDGGQPQLGWPVPKNKWELFTQRMHFLWRNNLYQFTYKKLSADTDPDSYTTIKRIGVKDSGESNQSYVVDKNGYFSYWKQVNWGSKMYLRIWLGWKFENDAGKDRKLLVVHVNPFRSYKK